MKMRMEMQRFIMLLAVLIMSAIFFTAQADTISTGDAQWDSQGVEPWVSGEDVNEVLDDTGILNHTHDIELPEAYETKFHDDILGLGIDLVLWQGSGKLEPELRADYRHDLRNRNNRVDVVMKLNVWNWLEKK